MKFLSPGSDDLVASKTDERAKRVEQADQMYTCLISQRGLMRDLIHAAAARITDPRECLWFQTSGTTCTEWRW
jgi:hypothetical protein